MRVKEDGSPIKPATVNTYVASVTSFLGFAHHVGFTRFRHHARWRSASWASSRCAS
jgi:hypothetical protein